jgi:hypothetical protein
MLAMFWDSQGMLFAHFQKRGKNGNSASYCEVLLKLQDAIRRKHPGQLARGILLHHDSARPHTAQATQERIQELQWELLEHPPYSLDLAPNRCFFQVRISCVLRFISFVAYLLTLPLFDDYLYN